jgi:hypothetical protein
LYTHDLRALVIQAGLAEALEDRRSRDAAFLAAWLIVADWTEASRYGTTDADRARAFMDALKHDEYGVVPRLLSTI